MRHERLYRCGNCAYFGRECDLQELNERIEKRFDELYAEGRSPEEAWNIVDGEFGGLDRIPDAPTEDTPPDSVKCSVYSERPLTDEEREEVREWERYRESVRTMRL